MRKERELGWKVKRGYWIKCRKVVQEFEERFVEKVNKGWWRRWSGLIEEGEDRLVMGKMGIIDGSKYSGDAVFSCNS